MHAQNKQKPNGDLVIVYDNGRREVLEQDRPFPLLQYLKKQYTAPRGGKLKITYSI
jgi:hypothetical protein